MPRWQLTVAPYTNFRVFGMLRTCRRPGEGPKSAAYDPRALRPRRTPVFPLLESKERALGACYSGLTLLPRRGVDR